MLFAYTRVATLPDETCIFATFTSKSLRVTVLGTAYSISEYGELLGWLASALYPPHPSSVPYRTPFVTGSAGNIGASQPLNILGHGQPGAVCFDIVILEHESNLTATGINYWPGLLDRYCSFVKGFPTASREHPGLELSLDLLFDLADATDITFQNEHVLIKGEKRSFVVAELADHTFIWHELHDSGEATSRSLKFKTDTSHTISLSELRTQRHIFRHCNPVRTFQAGKCRAACS